MSHDKNETQCHAEQRHDHEIRSPWLLAAIVATTLAGILLAVGVSLATQSSRPAIIGQAAVIPLLTGTMFTIILHVIERARHVITKQTPRPQDNADTEDLEAVVEARTNELLEAKQLLFQSEKLASVGQLAAGIAHEINTPTQYVGDNIRALADNFEDLCALIGKYTEAIDQAKKSPLTPEVIDSLEATKQEHDLDFILDDAPKAIEQGLEGTERIANIVRAMKDFSHVDRGELSVVNLNHALTNTLTVARNEYKYVSDVETDFGELPDVKCYVGELNQVFLNLIVNAAHAIADTNERGLITVRTRHDGDHVTVAISDTGTGIPDDIRQRVFDPFFTTKEIGKGTGQGLCIAHKIVVGKHAGSLDMETEVGQGTTFTVRIPVLQVTNEVQQEQDV